MVAGSAPSCQVPPLWMSSPLPPGPRRDRVPPATAITHYSADGLPLLPDATVAGDGVHRRPPGSARRADKPPTPPRTPGPPGVIAATDRGRTTRSGASGSTAPGPSGGLQHPRTVTVALNRAGVGTHAGADHLGARPRQGPGSSSPPPDAPDHRTSTIFNAPNTSSEADRSEP